MRTFILVIFWLLVLEEFLRAVEVSGGNYPRIITKPIDVFSLIINAAFIIWAAHLLWY